MQSGCASKEFENVNIKMKCSPSLDANSLQEIDPWYLRNLVCPIDHLPLKYMSGVLVSAAGKKYPVVEGIPVMLLEDAEQTLGVASASLLRVKGELVDDRAPELYLESLGISETEKVNLIELAKRKDLNIDPVVAYIVGATSGYSYKHLIGNLSSYPIPEIRLPKANGEMLLDLGCNWGRWCIAAARKGYAPVGVDPSLGAIAAARRIARQMNLPIKYVVADARYLPFAPHTFDFVFSYSVLQHFSKENVRQTLQETARVLKQNGTSLVQMPNAFGIRCLQHQAKRRFRAAQNFDVRYWTIPELKKTFEDKIGRSEVSVDCYFGLGLQVSDLSLMSPRLKAIIKLSERLRSISKRIPLLRYVADSIYVSSIRSDE